MKKNQQLLKKTGLLLIASLVFASLIFPLIMSQRVSAISAADDEKRRKLFTLKECLEDRIDLEDEGQEFSSYEDLFKDNDGEYVVAGFDRDSVNGTMKCSTLIVQGMRVLSDLTDISYSGGRINSNSPENDIKNAFIKQITRSDFAASGGDPIPNSGNVRQDRDAFKNRVDDILQRFDEPSQPNVLLTKRIQGRVNLASICWSISDEQPTEALGDHGFSLTINGKEVYFKEHDNEQAENAIQAGGFINEVGTSAVTTHNSLGDKDLGWKFLSGISDTGGGIANFSVWGTGGSRASDFYPFGKDIDGVPNILDCNFLRDHKDWLQVPGMIYENGAVGLDENGDGRIDERPDTSGDTSEVDLTCEIRLFNPLTYIACPLIEAAQEGVQKFDNAITQRLTIKVNGPNGYMNDSETGKSFYAAWSAFRYMALIILVIIGLVMVIAQATSAQLFDAYTVKKVMPRIFIAVIAITISWSLMKFAIQLTNEIGIGLRSMLFAPFANLSDPRIQQGAGSLLGIGALAGVGAGLAGLGMLGILTFALGALLAVLIGFGVIVFREMLVMLLVVTAPIAIICWIIPGTEKVWKMWSDFLLKALIAFPIITLMITVGHIFAKIAANGGNATLMETTIVFICYFGPYFMIPTAFKMAGGALATVSGMAYGKAQGASQALKGFRKKQWGKNMEKIDAAKRFNPEGKLAGLNRHLQTASIVGRGKAGINPALMRARANASRDSHIIREAEELREKSAAWRAIDADDTLTEAAQHAHGREAIERHLKASKRYGHLQGAELAQTVAAVEAAQKEAPRDVVAAASVMARAASGTGHADHADMYDDIMAATEGNQTLRNNLLAKTRSLSGQNGRPELAAPGHTFSEDNMREYSEGRITRDELNERMRTEALRVAGAHTIGNGREEYFGHQMDTLAQNYEDAVASGDVDQATEYAAQIASFRSVSGSLPPAQSEMINDMLARVGVQEDLIDPLTGSAYSVDEQLGMQLGGYDVNSEVDLHNQIVAARKLDMGPSQQQVAGQPTPTPLTPIQQANRQHLQTLEQQRLQLSRMPEKQTAQQRAQAVRTRAGLYDVGGGGRTPEQVRAAQMADPNQQP